MGERSATTHEVLLGQSADDSVDRPSDGPEGADDSVQSASWGAVESRTVGQRQHEATRVATGAERCL